MSETKTFEEFIEQPEIAGKDLHSQRSLYREYVNGPGAPKARN